MCKTCVYQILKGYYFYYYKQNRILPLKRPILNVYIIIYKKIWLFKKMYLIVIVYNSLCLLRIINHLLYCFLQITNIKDK